ncbi:MAG: DUF6702 family protein [Gemmatimonadota bacterium]|nr:DUF6702 family protein [Gemmatimonadota bacterium]
MKSIRSTSSLPVMLMLLMLPATTSFGQQEHPLYISICEIEHNTDTAALELTFKIFTDDLETALEEQGVGKLRLGTDREMENADEYIRRYIEKNVVIQVDDRSVELGYVGKEVEMDVAWCYVEVQGVLSIKSMTVSNTLLFELFEEQTNIVHINANKKKKSLMLNIANREGTVEY